MKNTYFAITSYKNINLPEGKILSKKPYEIILKNINPLHLTEQYKTEEQGDVERDLSNILNWLADKKGNILFVDESSICLSSGTIYSLINSV
ncbi:MAG: hypothetical protein GYA87_09780, partial [Christensenellaceae bacterium]|nr:hypothetical protein [Christensenellaceae bacterium]